MSLNERELCSNRRTDSRILFITKKCNYMPAKRFPIPLYLVLCSSTSHLNIPSLYGCTWCTVHASTCVHKRIVNQCTKYILFNRGKSHPSCLFSHILSTRENNYELKWSIFGLHGAKLSETNKYTKSKKNQIASDFFLLETRLGKALVHCSNYSSHSRV